MVAPNVPEKNLKTVRGLQSGKKAIVAEAGGGIGHVGIPIGTENSRDPDRIGLGPVTAKVRWDFVRLCLWKSLELATGFVGFFSQLQEHLHDAGVLARFGVEEKSIRGESVNGRRRTVEFCRSGANDGHGPELLVQEMGWLRHDQVGLESIPVQRFRARLALRLSQVCESHGGVVLLVEVG